MPLPVNLTAITVTGTYMSVDGTLATSGTVTLDPGIVLTDDAGTTIIDRPAIAQVVDGSISVTVPCTDNTALNPTGFAYTVTEKVNGARQRSYMVELPSTLGSTVDLSQLAPIADPPDIVVGAGGDLSGPYVNPVVVRTHLASPLPVAQGGTGLGSAGTAGEVLAADGLGGTAWTPGVLTATAVKTGAYTAQSGDLVPADISSGGFTVTLPSAPADRTRIALKVVNTAGGNTLTVACTGTDHFNTPTGLTSFPLKLPFQAVTVQYKASTGVWLIEDGLPLGALDARYNPMTSAGDMIYGAASGVTARLALGIPGAMMAAGATGPQWAGAPGLIASGDTTGATDTANIRGLLTLSGTAQLGPGAFYVSGSTAIAVAANSTVKGHGPQATIIVIASGFTGPSVFSLASGGYNQVSDLAIIGASSTIAANPQCDAIAMSGGRRSCADNIYFGAVNGWCVNSQAVTGGGTFTGYATMLSRLSGIACAGGIHIKGLSAGNYGAQHFLHSLNFQQIGCGSGPSANLDVLRIEDANDITCTNTNMAIAGGLAPPSAPVLTAGTGTLAAGTYQGAFTYVNPAGETLISAVTSITVGSGSSIIATSPANSQNSSGWNFYCTQPGGSTLTLQTGTPVAIGTNYTLSAPPSSGTAVPSANTSGSSGDTVNIMGHCSTGQYNVGDWGSYPNYPGQSANVLSFSDTVNGSPTDQHFVTGVCQQGQNGIFIAGGANKLDFGHWRIFNNYGSGSKCTGTGDSIQFTSCQWASNGQGGPANSGTYYDHEVTNSATGKTVTCKYNSPVVSAGSAGVQNVVALPSSGYNWNHIFTDFTGSGTPATPFTHAPALYTRGDTSPPGWFGRMQVQSGQSGSNAGFIVTNTASGASVPFNRWQAAAVADLVHGVYVSGDTIPRLQIDAAGKHWWSTGSGSLDTNLYRSAAGLLKTDNDLVVAGAGTIAGPVYSNLIQPQVSSRPALAATLARTSVTTAQTATGSGSGVLLVCLIPLPKNLTVTGMMWQTAANVKTGGTHGWYVLLDNNRNVLAVTADQTDAATVWGAANTEYSLDFGASYTTTYAGAFYAGVMVAESGGTMPNFMGGAALGSGVASVSPAMGGTSDTGLTTPPAIGHTFGAISAQGNCNFYVVVS